jgi:uncharacterized membrane protein
MFSALFLLALLVVLIVLLIRVERLSARVNALQARFEGSERQKTPVETPRTPAAEPVLPVPAEPRRQDLPLAAATVRDDRPSPSVSPQIPLPPSRSKEEWEALIGGKLLNRIGALALFIGIGFFLKYAFDNNWITETFRVLIGAAVGAASLVLAERAMRKGFAVFAQGLLGAGLAILYLSVYASFNFYRLLPQLPAFVLMAAVTTLAFTLAFRYDSPAVSFIGWLGGFLTPFLLSTGESNQVGLFTYLLLLDAGVLIVLRKKQDWSILEPLTIAGTYAVYFFWFATSYEDSLLTSTLLFAGLFWLLFHALDLFLVFRTAPPPLRRLIGWMNGFLAYWALILPTARTGGSAMTVSLLLLAFFYALSAFVILRGKPGERSTAVQYILAAFILLALVLLNEYERFALPAAWAAEALVILFLARHLASRPVAIAAEVLFALAFLKLLVTPGAILFEPLSLFAPIWNIRFPSFLVLIAAGAGSALLLKRLDRPQEAELFHYGWILLLLVLLSAEINDSFRTLSIDATAIAADAAGFQRTMTIAVGWMVIGLTLLACARRGVLRPFLFAGSSLVLVASSLGGIRGTAFVPMELFRPVFNVRFSGLIFLVGGGLLAIRLLRHLRGRSPWAGEFSYVVQVVAALLGVIVLTSEIRDTFRQIIAATGAEYRGSDDLTRLENLKQLALSGGWLLYSIFLMGIGLWRRLRAVRILAICLFACTILKIFIYDLSFLDTLYRFVSFIALGAILLVVSYLYQRYRGIIFEPSRE